jgi:hypothetical protein
MKRPGELVLLGALAGAAAIAASCTLRAGKAPAEGSVGVDRPPRIRPDYTGTVIPPNIAPLNFVIREPGAQYHVTVRSAQGESIEVASRSPRIVLPARKWGPFLEANRGGQLHFDVYVKSQEGQWQRFEPVANEIANEEIDRYLVYRLIHPLYNFFQDIGIYQRDLEGYGQRELLHGRSMADCCINCHAFLNNRTSACTIGIRSGAFGSSALLVQGNSVSKIGTKFGYTSWHPSGRVVAYSANKVRQFFHWARAEVRDVVDLDSELAYYDVASQTAKSHPSIADPDRLETYPAWSADGKYLYFCSAAFPWENRRRMPPENFDQCRYDLMRVSYDIDTDTWGEPETVLSSEETGLSILLPRISPDGRFLLFCMCDYGCFPIYQPSSDLYMMDLTTGEYSKPDINSEKCESWHSWSSNGRWIAFSSKRRDGLFTRSYLSYVDETGKAHRPFILPQKDPEFYDSYLKTYSVPELVVEPLRPRQRHLAEAVRWPGAIEVESPVTFDKKTELKEVGDQQDAWQESR